MSKILIKTFFNGTKEVSKEKAEKWVQHLLNGANNRAGAVEVINSRLFGISFENLINDR